MYRPFFLFFQCPWGSSPHPYSRCSMPPGGQAWGLWANQSGSWPTTLRLKFQKWMCITMKWTLSLTSAHAGSTGNMCSCLSLSLSVCQYTSTCTHPGYIYTKDRIFWKILCVHLSSKQNPLSEFSAHPF